MERLTLKSQIVIAYGVMAVAVCAISIALSVIMLQNLSASVYNDSYSILVSQSRTNAQDLAKGVASSAAQDLESLSNSMNKVSSRYGKILLTTTDPRRPTPTIIPFQLLKPFPTFAEFNFTRGCAATGGCPSDYGPLSTRCRFPFLVGAENGSLAHTSAHLFSSSLQRTIRTTVEWNAEFAASPALTDVRDALALQDEDLKVMYSNNGSMVTLVSLAAKVTGNHTTKYHSLLRTYPGISRGAGSYDAATRPWFTDARTDIPSFYGPYMETSSRQRVVTLSFKQSFPYRNHTVDLVSAVAINMDIFRLLVTSIEYGSGGFAVIFNKQTQEVLAWGNRTDFMEADTNALKTVRDMDPSLPVDLCSASTFEYTDAAGTEWLAGCADSFRSSIAMPVAPNVIGSALMTIVFAQKTLAVQPLDALRNHMDESSTSVRDYVLIVVLGLAFIVMLLVLAAVWNITSPLSTMRRVALQVIDQMAEDEEVRDFAPLLNKAGFNVERSDEVGVLACDFYQVMCLMHNKVVAKRAVARYPPNPWRLDCEGEEDTAKLSDLTWQDLRALETSRQAQQRIVEAVDTATRTSAAEVASTASSIKGSIKASTKLSAQLSTRASRRHVRLAGRVVPLAIDQLATISTSKPVGWLTCLRAQLSALAALLVLGVIGAMLLTIVTVERDSGSWSDDSANAVVAKQVLNLEAIAAMKATFAETYFAQMTMDLRTTAAAMTSMLMGDFTTPEWEAEGKYLHSYSVDPKNPHSVVNLGYPFSSYYRYPDAGCIGAACDVVRNSTESRLASLLDMKMESLVYPNTYLQFIQTANEATGYIRFWPILVLTSFSSPLPMCWVSAVDTPECASRFYNSKCGNASLPAYPPYEPRCRDWYSLARLSNAPQFMTPRAITGGTYVLTSVLNVPNPRTGSRLGVINLNFYVSALRTLITGSPIMVNGYNYIVDPVSPDNVIIHPRHTLTCSTVRCVEALTAEEYTALKRTVLQAGSGASNTYMKGGQVWRVATHRVRYGTVNYLLVATVPEWEVVAFATKAQDTIDQATQDMVVGFGAAIAAVVVCMALVIATLVRLIMKPLDDLRLVIGLALRKDFTKELPKQAGSADMAALMHAITQLLVALRLDACADDSADIARMHAVFVDSVNLFTATGNRKGLGASLSNLAALELAMGDVTAAQEHYLRSIELAKEQVAQLEVAPAGGDEEAALLNDELRRARRVVSDRQGSLAVALLETQDETAAAALLSRTLEEDKRHLHIRGCIVKQSILGQAFLKQKQLADAEQVFTASLALVRELQQSSAVRGSAMSEADACEMLALCDLAALAEARNWHTTLESLHALERKYLEALMTPAHMELGTARRVLRSLLDLYDRHPQFVEAKRGVQGIADAHGLSLTAAAMEGMAVAKRVVLVLDYSSSMAGSRVRSVKDALHKFMKEHVHARDSVAILSFNNSVQEVLPLIVKAGNAMHIAKRVESMVAPVGGTTLYDGVLRAIKVLQPPRAGDWIVLLADGADDKSKCTGGLPEVLREVTAARVSVAALGIGPDAPVEVLQLIAQAARRGLCECLPATKADLLDLFQEAARALQAARATLEEF